MDWDKINAVPHMRDATQLRGLDELCSWAMTKTERADAAEIGVYAGEATSIFANYFTRVTAVDPWLNGYDDGDLASHMAPMDKVFAAFLEREAHSAGVIRHLRNTSLAAANFIADRSLDFLYLDADHRYEHVLADLGAWRPKLRPGAVLAGHDFSFPSVSRALQDFLGRDHLLTHFPGDSWATTL